MKKHLLGASIAAAVLGAGGAAIESAPAAAAPTAVSSPAVVQTSSGMQKLPGTRSLSAQTAILKKANRRYRRRNRSFYAGNRGNWVPRKHGGKLYYSFRER